MHHNYLAPHESIALLAEAQKLAFAAQFEQALILCEQVEGSFRQQQDMQNEVKTMLLQCRCMLELDKFNDSLSLAQETLDLCQAEIGLQQFLIAKCHEMLGVIYNALAKYDLSLHHHQAALQIRQAELGERNFFVGLSYSQLGLYYINTGQYNQAIKSLLQAEDIFLTNPPAEPEQMMQIANHQNNCGVYYMTISQHHTATQYFEKALAVKLALVGETHPASAHTYYCMSVNFRENGNFKLALQYIDKYLPVLLQTVGRKHSDTAYCYFIKGSIYCYSGDYYHTLYFFHQALSIRNQIFEPQHQLVLGMYANIGVCYRLMKDYLNAITYLSHSLNAFKLHYPESVEVAHNLNELAICYQLSGQNELAIQLNLEALAITKKELPAHHNINLGIITNLGLSYLGLQQTSQAQEYLHEALQIARSLYGNLHIHVASAFKNIASCYFCTGNYNQALFHCQDALQSLEIVLPNPQDTHLLPDLSHYSSAHFLLEILTLKAQILNTLYRQTADINDLQAALSHYQCADALIDQMRSGYKQEGSKHTLAETAKKLYDSALSAFFTAPPSSTQDMAALAFQYLEKSRAVLLFSNIKELEARNDGQIPPQLLQQEYDWRIEITNIEKQRAQALLELPEAQNKQQLDQWQDQLFTLKHNYQNLIEQFEKDYPDYYLLKYQTEPIKLHQLQKILQTTENTFILSFFVGAEQIYLFAVTTNTTHFLALPKPADFAGLIDDFLFSVKTKDKSDYLTYAHALYQILLHDILTLLQAPPDTRLLILPDDVLSLIPFEALLTQNCSPNPAYNNLPYLICQYDVSYHFSATLWSHGLQKAAQSAQIPPSFIGFAPVYSNQNAYQTEEELQTNAQQEIYGQLLATLSPATTPAPLLETLRSVTLHSKTYLELPFAEQEVNHIAQIFTNQHYPAMVQLHQHANLTNFQQQAQHYKYVLIAAHGDYNDQHPQLTGIIFSPSDRENVPHVLYQADIYNLTLKADLIVLSCCETGLGVTLHGEGIMAFNRGFLFAGANNVVYTFFKVYDQASFELTTLFFEQIFKNKTYHEALRAAKLQLIQSKSLPPVFWSGYVLIGN